jgi:hypothetical protein
VYVEEGSLIQSSSFHAVNGDSVNGDCRSYFIQVVGYSLLATPIPADNSPPAVYPNYVAFHQQLQANANESHAQLLARSQDAVCYFTALGGDFRSRDERAQISLQWVGGQEFWELETTAGAGNVEAEVSCLSYDQRHPTIVTVPPE